MVSPVEILMIFTAAAQNFELQQKWQLTVSSMLEHASVPINLHLVGDAESRKLVRDYLLPQKIKYKLTEKQFSRLKLLEYDMSELSQQIDRYLGDELIRYFRYSASSYYGHNLFFLSIIAHKLFYPKLTKIIQIDSDLKFMSDVADLWREFKNFQAETVMGLAYEQQPVYRHVFSQYRSHAPNTRIGSPPPDGKTGFNSGVLMIDLKAMNQSQLYNSLIDVHQIEELVKRYHFKGHLGDQDLYTLLATEYGQLFHVLPCQFNRQLCRWWESHGYTSVFDEYHTCDAEVKIYHGNCNTPIP